MKYYFEIFEILVKSLKSCEISWDFEISYVILPHCGPLGMRVCMGVGAERSSEYYVARIFERGHLINLLIVCNMLNCILYFQ